MSLIAQYIDYIAIERNFSAHTVRAYERDLINFCEFLGCTEDEFEQEIAEKIIADDIRAWVSKQSILDKCSARTIRRRLSALQSFWKYLMRKGWADTNPVRKIIAPKVPKRLPEFYKPQEMERVMQLAQQADDFVTVRDFLMIRMFYETGMRRAELYELKDKNIDLVNGEIRVFGKRRKERFIPIGEGLQQAIKRYFEMRGEMLNDLQHVHSLNDAMFLNTKGEQLSYSQIYIIIHQILQEVSSNKKLSPHVLRHTFATTMLNNGADINSLKLLMGHASLAATQIYTHVNIDQLLRVYKDAHPRCITEN